MSDSDILIDLDLDDRDFDSKLRDVLSGAKSNSQKIANTYKNSFKGVGSGFKLLVGGAIAGFSARALIGGIKNVVELSSIQQDAVNQLNSSLMASGDYSQKASQDMQDFASKMQEVSTVGDETTLGVLAYAKALGASNEKAKEMVKASLDASSALKVDMRTVVQGLSQTMTGQVGILGRYIPELKNLTSEQLKNGDAISFLQGKYDGFAKNELNTFAGVSESLGGYWGDFLEKIGDGITKSPTIIALMNMLRVGADKLGKVMSEIDFEKYWSSGIDTVFKLGTTFEKYFVPPVKKALIVFTALKDGFVLGINVIRKAVSKYYGLVGKGASWLGNFFGNETLKKLGAGAKWLSESLDVNLEEKANETAEKLKGKLKDLLAPEEMTNNIETLKGQFSGFVDSINSKASEVNTKSLKNKITNTLGAIQKETKKASFSIKSHLVSAISGGIQSIANALSSGENLLKAFGKFMLNTFADLAIKLGEFYILNSSAMLALKNLDPTGGIVAGVALVALGAIMKSAFGGNSTGTVTSSASSSPSSEGGGVAMPSGYQESNPVVDGPEEELRTVGTTVHVSVEGNIFDLEQTGQAIVESVNRAFETTGVQISGGAVA